MGWMARGEKFWFMRCELWSAYCCLIGFLGFLVSWFLWVSGVLYPGSESESESGS